MPEYTSYNSGADWEKRWIPQYRQIIGYYLLHPSTLEEDQTLAKDMVVLEALTNLSIGCRLRTPGYGGRFGSDITDITITCKRETGSACEWDKMIASGSTNWFFYGHTTDYEPSIKSIKPWYIINLDLARAWMKENHGPMLGPNKDEPGRRCWFYAFDIRKMIWEIGDEVLIASSMPKKQSIQCKNPGCPSTEAVCLSRGIIECPKCGYLRVWLNFLEN